MSARKAASTTPQISLHAIQVRFRRRLYASQVRFQRRLYAIQVLFGSDVAVNRVEYLGGDPFSLPAVDVSEGIG
jgi:hypothetical protein